MDDIFGVVDDLGALFFITSYEFQLNLR